ncbi:MAG: multicopper oxidase domain-containing protein [Lewinellaceae bacterium]|nr:multicopper oxidase domain-containing protein [Lewinellaceae bacterium]
MDGKTLTEADKIIIRKGDNVRFILVNKSMMNHPMHLHGHFFRVLNGQGDYAPLKHTVNVPPMGTVTLEFSANEDKDWFFHCHILYHMMTGMARVVSYEGSTVAPELAAARKDIKEKMDNQWFFWGMGKLHNQLSEWELTLSNTRNQLNLEEDGDWKGISMLIQTTNATWGKTVISGFLQGQQLTASKSWFYKTVNLPALKWKKRLKCALWLGCAICCPFYQFRIAD